MEKKKRKCIKRTITANELLVLLNNQWARVTDIMAIGCMGHTKATQVMKNIKEQIEVEGYKLPRDLVPMAKVIDYFKININFLKKVRCTDEK